MDTRNDAIVEALQNLAAHDTLDRRAMLFQLMVDSTFVVATPEGGEPGETAPVLVETVGLQMARDADGVVLPLFTDADALARWAPAGGGHASLRARPLFHMAVQQGVAKVVINPGSEASAEITRREFSSLAEGRLPVGPVTDFVAPHTRMQLGRPPAAPSAVGLDAVRRAIEDEGSASRAFYTWLRQGENEPGIGIVVFFSGGVTSDQVDAAMQGIAGESAAQSTETHGWVFLVGDPDMEVALVGGAGTEILALDQEIMETGPWEHLGPRVVRHRDGYTVQFSDRFHVEYLEGAASARMAFSDGRSMDLRPRTIEWTAPVPGPPTAEDRYRILDRVLEGLREMGVSYEVVET